MGKGTIVSGGTGGYYSISLQLDATAIAARIVDLQARLVDLQSKITDAESTLDDLEDDLKKVLNEQDALIDAFAADSTADNLKALTEKAKEVAAAAAQVGLQRSAVAALVVEEASVRKEITRLSAAPSSVAAGAWCADYTEDLTGDVGVVTVPGGEREQHLQILPGYDGGAAYDANRDGMLRQPFTDSAAATYYNLAMLPGWQKWIPRYRLAQINSIDAEEGTCSLTIASASSGQQGLGVNYATSYSAVPIEYMTCDHEAFADGDIVVVEFVGQTADGIEGNWAAGKLKVIGFASNPKPCDQCMTGFSYDAGATFLDLSGSISAESPPLLVGDRDWLSLDGKVHISWDGGGGRRYWGLPDPANYYLYCSGDYIRDSVGDPIVAPGSIAGAAYNASRELIYVLIHSDLGANGQSLLVYKMPATVNNCILEPSGPFVLLQDVQWALTEEIECGTPVFFNGSATKFAFVTREGPSDGYGCRDLWEGEVFDSSVSLAMLYEHTELGTLDRTWTPACSDNGGDPAEEGGCNSSSTTILTIVQNGNISSVHYYCCDYSGDTLVYATIETAYDSLSNYQGMVTRSGSTYLDQQADVAVWTVTKDDSYGMLSFPLQSLVFHGVALDTVQYLGSPTYIDQRTESANGTYHDADPATVTNDLYKKLIGFGSSLLLGLDLRSGVILYYLQNMEEKDISRDRKSSERTGIVYIQTPLKNYNVQNDYQYSEEIIGGVNLIGCPCSATEFSDTLDKSVEAAEGMYPYPYTGNWSLAAHRTSRSYVIAFTATATVQEVALNGVDTIVTDDLTGAWTLGSASI